MDKYTTHIITVKTKDGGTRKHELMAADDMAAIGRVKLNDGDSVVGIHRTNAADVKPSERITHVISFKTDSGLFGDDVVHHYVSASTDKRLNKHIDTMTKKNPNYKFSESRKLEEGVGIKYSELKEMISESIKPDKWMVFHPKHTHGLIVVGKPAARALLKHMHDSGHPDMVMAPCGRGDKPIKSKILHEDRMDRGFGSDLKRNADENRKPDYASSKTHELVNAASLHKPPIGETGDVVSHFRVTYPGGRITHHSVSNTDHREIMDHIKTGKRVEHYNPETKKYSVLAVGAVGR